MLNGLLKFHVCRYVIEKSSGISTRRNYFPNNFCHQLSAVHAICHPRPAFWQTKRGAGEALSSKEPPFNFCPVRPSPLFFSFNRTPSVGREKNVSKFVPIPRDLEKCTEGSSLGAMPIAHWKKGERGRAGVWALE